jgi:hypothetical protein
MAESEQSKVENEKWSVTNNKKHLSSRELIINQLKDNGDFAFSGFIQNEVTTSPLTIFKILAKTYKLPFSQANTISTDDEYVEKLAEDHYTGWLKQAVQDYHFIWEDNWEQIDSKMHYCYDLNKMPWNSSVHASGVILTEDNADLPSRDNIIDYNGVDVESAGYIKYDMLSIDTLDFIQYFMGLNVNWNKTDDPNVWKTIISGDTDFVFQFSSVGMKKLLSSITYEYKNIVKIFGVPFELKAPIVLSDGSKITAEELFKKLQNGESVDIDDNFARSKHLL